MADGQNVSSSPLVRFAVWLSTPVTEARWLMILLWICVAGSALNGIRIFVEALS